MEGGKNQMAGHCSLDGDFRGVDITDLPHHDDVRILPEEGFEGGGKGHAHIFFDRNLVNPLKVELHRVLGGEDLNIILVQAVENGIQGGGFA